MTREELLEQRCERFRHFITHYCFDWHRATDNFYKKGLLTLNDLRYLHHDQEIEEEEIGWNKCVDAILGEDINEQNNED